jgi:hypothetical protein
MRWHCFRFIEIFFTIHCHREGIQAVVIPEWKAFSWGGVALDRLVFYNFTYFLTNSGQENPGLGGVPGLGGGISKAQHGLCFIGGFSSSSNSLIGLFPWCLINQFSQCFEADSLL